MEVRKKGNDGKSAFQIHEHRRKKVKNENEGQIRNEGKENRNNRIKED